MKKRLAREELRWQAGAKLYRSQCCIFSVVLYRVHRQTEAANLFRVQQNLLTFAQVREAMATKFDYYGYACADPHESRQIQASDLADLWYDVIFEHVIPSCAKRTVRVIQERWVHTGRH